MNNSFQNAINPGKYHVKIFDLTGQAFDCYHYNIPVRTFDEELSIDNDILLIKYNDIQRIEIHACAFPYKENTPFLYIYLK